MKLVSFKVPTPMGTSVRLGALRQDSLIADLQSAYRAHLQSERHLPHGAATRLSMAMIPSDMVAFIENGDLALDAAEQALSWIDQEGLVDQDGLALTFAKSSVQVLAPIPRPPLIRDFMAFEQHLKNIYPRLGRDIPQEWYNLPVYYKGNPGSVGADGDTVAMPPYASSMDFEFEFAAVIGKPGINIPRERAMAHVYGYMIYNDFSAREIQQREMSVGLGPAKGKDFQRGHVLGPYLVTADEIPDVYALRMTATVNDEHWCTTSTAGMHWRFDQMIEHASMGEMLAVGEVFGSGTCAGGSAAEVGRSLSKGDVVSLEMERLGRLTNTIG